MATAVITVAIFELLLLVQIAQNNCVICQILNVNCRVSTTHKRREGDN